MTLDFLLSALHFLLALALAAILAAQGALLRPGLSAQSLSAAANLDRLYGAAAGLLLVAGFGRVFYGAKGSQFYLDNPVFWAKIACFGAVAVFSIPLTVRLVRWSRQARRQAGFLPADGEVLGTRRWLLAQAVVFVFIPVLGAAMARAYGIR
jgi:putative membrane protein